MSAREEMLAKIKNAVSSNVSDVNRTAIIESRIKSHPIGVQPETMSSQVEIIDHFIAKAEKAASTVVRCSKQQIEEEIISYMRQHNLPLALRMGDDKRLEAYGIGQNAMLEVSTGPSDGSDEVTVSHAFAGASETGTLALVSGHENPTTLNFLASNHIVVLDEKDLLLHQEDIWVKLRETYGVGEMPRTFNFITGPSRSADIQQTLILGAHGPLGLHIIIAG